MQAMPARLGHASHNRVLDIIRSSGPISRVEIAQLAGLVPASVTNIVRVLVADGLVQESGQSVSTGGKPRTLLHLVPEAVCAAGVLLEPGGVTYVITNMAGRLIGRQRRVGTAGQSPDVVVQRIGAELSELIDLLGISRHTIVGTGVVGAGVVDIGNGVVAGIPADPAWRRYNLREALATELGMAVAIDNDATAAAIGEFWRARSDQPDAFACLYMEDRLGAGVMYDGAALRGSTSNVGKIGHVTIDVDGEFCPCGNRGCLELFASPKAVVDNAVKRGMTFATRADTTMRRFDAIGRRAVSGDPAARQLIQDSARYIGAGVISLTNLVDVDLVVLSGSAFAIAGAIYADALRSAIAASGFSRSIHAVEVQLSTNPRDAAALGASAMVLQGSLAPRS